MDTIIIRGKSYRVEVSWSVICQLCEMKGITDLSELQNIAKFAPAEVTHFIYLALEQGARMNGVQLDISESELAEVMKLPDVMAFIAIFNKQSNANIPTSDDKKKEVPKKKKLSLFTR